MSKERIGKCIKMAMSKKGISSNELSQVLGVSKTTISSYRAGNNDSLATLHKIAKACDMEFCEMLRLAD